MYERYDKAEAVSKGEFSFLIAFAKQLDRALELGDDGPDFLQDALGRLAHALEGLSGGLLDAEADGDEPDDGSGDDDDSSGGLQDPLADGVTRPRSRGRVLGGTVPGTRPLTQLPTQAVRRLGAPETPVKEAKRGKKQTKTKRRR